MTTISISLVQPEHLKEIRNIQQKVWIATYPNKELGITVEAIQVQFTDKDKTKGWIQQVENALKSGKSIGWMARINNKIVGYSFAIKTEAKNRIMSMYVLPEYQRQGIGRALMVKMIEWTDKTKPMTLEVASYNKKAINFYKSFGFIENGLIQNEVAALQTGLVIPEIEMVKNI